jgi:catalase
MTLVRPALWCAKVMDNAQRDRLVSNVVGHLKKGVTDPVLARAIEYWRNIDQAVGDRVANAVKGGRMAAE